MHDLSGKHRAEVPALTSREPLQPLRAQQVKAEVWGQQEAHAISLGSSRPAAFPGPTEPGEQGRWQKQRRVGELPATSASASASQAEQQSVGWTGLCVCVGVCAWDCAVLGFLFTRLLFEKISNINSDHLNILHLDSIIDFATLVFSLFTLCICPSFSLSFLSLYLSMTI